MYCACLQDLCVHGATTAGSSLVKMAVGSPIKNHCPPNLMIDTCIRNSTAFMELHICYMCENTVRPVFLWLVPR